MDRNVPASPLSLTAVAPSLPRYVPASPLPFSIGEMTVTAYSTVPASGLSLTPVSPTWLANYLRPVMTIPDSWSMRWTATTSDNSIVMTLPAPTMAIIGGSRIEFVLPLLEMAVSGTVQSLLRLEMELPELTMTLEGTLGSVATLAMELPAPAMSLSGGGRLEVVLPNLEMTLVGSLQNLVRMAMELPAPTFSLSGTLGSVATLAMELPAPTIRIDGTVGGVLSLTMCCPSPVIDIRWTDADSETTYAINLNTGAVTQLLLGAFDKLVTAHGRLYGLRSGAMVRLDGDLDGAATIPATIRFAPQQFGTLQLKRMDGHVHLNLRENDGVTLTVVQDETTAWTYQTAMDAAPAIGTHRVRVGRGISFHSLGVVLRNRNGGRLDVGGIEIPVLPLSRKQK